MAETSDRDSRVAPRSESRKASRRKYPWCETKCRRGACYCALPTTSSPHVTRAYRWFEQTGNEDAFAKAAKHACSFFASALESHLAEPLPPQLDSLLQWPGKPRPCRLERERVKQALAFPLVLLGYAGIDYPEMLPTFEYLNGLCDALERLDDGVVDPLLQPRPAKKNRPKAPRHDIAARKILANGCLALEFSGESPKRAAQKIAQLASQNGFLRPGGKPVEAATVRYWRQKFGKRPGLPITKRSPAEVLKRTDDWFKLLNSTKVQTNGEYLQLYMKWVGIDLQPRRLPQPPCQADAHLVPVAAKKM